MVTNAILSLDVFAFGFTSFAFGSILRNAVSKSPQFHFHFILLLFSNFFTHGDPLNSYILLYRESCYNRIKL